MKPLTPARFLIVGIFLAVMLFTSTRWIPFTMRVPDWAGCAIGAVLILAAAVQHRRTRRF